jgi:hypothetical protein
MRWWSVDQSPRVSLDSFGNTILYIVDCLLARLQYHTAWTKNEETEGSQIRREKLSTLTLYALQNAVGGRSACGNKSIVSKEVMTLMNQCSNYHCFHIFALYSG